MEVIDIYPASNCLEIKYAVYYRGNKKYPEVHLKTLLTAYADSRMDIRDPEVFDALVERARQDLGEKHKDCKEKRLKHFATLFKKLLIGNGLPNKSILLYYTTHQTLRFFIGFLYACSLAR